MKLGLNWVVGYFQAQALKLLVQAPPIQSLLSIRCSRLKLAMGICEGKEGKREERSTIIDKCMSVLKA